MKILVAGGAGFIGSHFVEWTLKNREGVEIVVVDKCTYASLKGLPVIRDLGVRILPIDISKRAAVMSLRSENPDLIVNFAAESHNDNSIRDPFPFYSTNVLGTLNLCDLALAADARYHQISTDEVFGDFPVDSSELFTEDSPYRPSSPYSASKASADHTVRAWVRTFGLKATISNCSNNFGPRQHSEKFIPRSIDLLLQGKPIEIYGTGENVRDWIHVEDHVLGIWAVLDHGLIGETYLLGARCEYSNLQVANILLETLGRGPEMIKFISDRPGHDWRYGINPDKANRELGWRAMRSDFPAELGALAQGLA